MYITEILLFIFSFYLDVNECEIRPSLCSPNGKCLNLEGNYTCNCSQGWTGDNCLTGKFLFLHFSLRWCRTLVDIIVDKSIQKSKCFYRFRIFRFYDIWQKLSFELFLKVKFIKPIGIQTTDIKIRSEHFYRLRYADFRI